jgi:hypothetical protein
MLMHSVDRTINSVGPGRETQGPLNILSLILAFRLVREMTWLEGAWFILLMTALVYFGTGQMCHVNNKPTTKRVERKEIKFFLAYPWRTRKRRCRRRRMRQYHLRKRVAQRPRLAVRDPPRRWYDPRTWRWRRRVPIQRPKKKKEKKVLSEHHPTPEQQKSDKRKKRRHQYKSRRERAHHRKRTRWKWESDGSEKELFELVKPRYLHDSDIMYGMQF